jgi:metal-responsive CopG/Arc/MetJ family transcriptional regulator
MGKFRTVSLPENLYNKVKKICKEKKFGSVSAYVTYILREIIATKPKDKKVTDKEIAEIIVKLKRLGYL